MRLTPSLSFNPVAGMAVEATSLLAGGNIVVNGRSPKSRRSRSRKR